MRNKIRCPYFELNDLERAYHDKEWGTPCRNDRKLFEYLMYEVLTEYGSEWRIEFRNSANAPKMFRQVCLDAAAAPPDLRLYLADTIFPIFPSAER